MAVESGSSMGLYQACPKKSYYSSELRLESGGLSEALAFGSMTHGWIEKYSGVGRDDAPEQEMAALKERVSEDFHSKITGLYQRAERVAGLWKKHWDDPSRVFSNENYHKVESEKEWRFGVGDHIHVGKRDGLWLDKKTGKAFIHEAKTAAVSETFFNRLELERQISSNLIAATMDGHQPSGVIMDVLFKPAIRLLRDRKTKPDETESEFNERFVKAIEDEPERFFQREIVYRTSEQLATHLKDLEYIFAQMKHSRENGAWPRNTGNCDSFGKLCPYFSVCLGGHSEADLMATFRVRDKRLPELSDGGQCK